MNIKIGERSCGRGVFVTIDGPGGVGKSTAVAATTGYLRKIGAPVHSTAQPSSSALGRFVRAHANTYQGMALACLVAGDRLHQQTVEIGPRLDAGRVVVCDRYLPSSLVLQVRDGVSPETVWELNRTVRPPDVAVFLYDEPEAIHRRLTTRGAHNRFEADPGCVVRELAMFATVADDLIRLGWPVHLIDCAGLELCEIGLMIANLVLPQLPDDILKPRQETECRS
ncbi:dTMP kinase [Nocardia sp. NPDC051570]|uniref:dTMP kinase n=1 Tax=Nocardia sp. NPDC051570 TaxID=3364324 RepID=UPI0037A5E1C8